MVSNFVDVDVCTLLHRLTLGLLEVRYCVKLYASCLVNVHDTGHDLRLTRRGLEDILISGFVIILALPRRCFVIPVL